MSRSVLFLPQNDTHAETTALLARELAGLGVASTVLDLDHVFHQGTARYLNGMRVVQTPLLSERPFYRLSPWRQARVVAQARPLARGWLDGMDGVVAFNDGALQRVVLGIARARGLQTDLVLDGMITHVDAPPSMSAILRRGLQAIGRHADRVSADSYFPSEVGLYAVDRTHVAGEHSVDVLRSRGSRARALLASGLPRWPDCYFDFPTRAQHVLYLTGAFRWHGDRETARAQLLDVYALADACQASGLDLMIRVHPRDDSSQYVRCGGIVVDARSEPLSGAILRSDLCLSVISTGLLEAVMLGRPSRALVIHPRWSRYRRSFVADNMFDAIRSTDQLRVVLARLARAIDARDLQAQRDGLSRYVAATGSTAAGLIARAVASNQP